MDPRTVAIRTAEITIKQLADEQKEDEEQTVKALEALMASAGSDASATFKDLTVTWSQDGTKKKITSTKAMTLAEFSKAIRALPQTISGQVTVAPEGPTRLELTNGLRRRTEDRGARRRAAMERIAQLRAGSD